MSAFWTRLALVVVVVSAGMLAGCKNGQLRDERNRLYSQNQELQSALTQTRAQLDAAEADRRNLAMANDQLRAQMEAARNQPAPAAQPAAPAPAAPAAAANTGFSAIEGVETVRSADRVTVRVPGDVLFDSGKADLKATSLRTLDKIAAVIQREYRTNTIRVEGYTDTDPIRRSKWRDNMELSRARAAAVERYLQRRGVDASRVQVVGYGSAKPQATKAKSRRVEIVVLQ